MENKQKAYGLLGEAKQGIIEDMESRGIAAIIWNVETAGFPFLPEIDHKSEKDSKKQRVATVMGLYRYDDVLYAIEKGRAPVEFSALWNPDTEAAPTVVTLSESAARERLGDPEKVKGYTVQGTIEEWAAIADCYFQALNQD